MKRILLIGICLTILSLTIQAQKDKTKSNFDQELKWFSMYPFDLNQRHTIQLWRAFMSSKRENAEFLNSQKYSDYILNILNDFNDSQKKAELLRNTLSIFVDAEEIEIFGDNYEREMLTQLFDDDDFKEKYKQGKPLKKVEYSKSQIEDIDKLISRHENQPISASFLKMAGYFKSQDLIDFFKNNVNNPLFDQDQMILVLARYGVEPFHNEAVNRNLIEKSVEDDRVVMMQRLSNLEYVNSIRSWSEYIKVFEVDLEYVASAHAHHKTSFGREMLANFLIHFRNQTQELSKIYENKYGHKFGFLNHKNHNDDAVMIAKNWINGNLMEIVECKD